MNPAIEYAMLRKQYEELTSRYPTQRLEGRLFFTDPRIVDIRRRLDELEQQIRFEKQ